MSKRVLVVSAHIGDEILGCGGTMLRHVQQGDSVSLVVLGEGWTSRTKSLQKGLEAVDLDAFEDQARAALQILLIRDIQFHRLPDNRFDRLEQLDVVKIIEGYKTRLQPDIVYTNSVADLGVDQRTTCLAVATAFRPLPGESFSELRTFEVRSSTEWSASPVGQSFQPNHFVDIGAMLSQKISALESLSTEARAWPHSRSASAVQHHALSRGASVGLEAAEAFSVVRSIRRMN